MRVQTVLFLLFSLLPAYALELTGYAETEGDFALPRTWGDDRYDSLLNPGNILGLEDVSSSMDGVLKVEEFQDKGTFALWLSLEEGASDSYDLEILQLNLSWNMTDALKMTLGRQSFLTGYGYGWNPMDLVNPLKDPAEPEKDLSGVDALAFQIDRGGAVLGMFFAALPDEGGRDYGEMEAGGLLTFLLPMGEVKVAGLSGEHDAWSGGFLMDLLGAGLYGEASWREKSRLYDRGDPAVSFLAGLEYVFTSELAATVEYFFNGEGMDRSERKAFRDDLEYFNDLYGAAPEEYYQLYMPGYFSRHYFLLNLFLPVYSLWSETAISVIYSPDSASLGVLPQWTVLPTGNLEITVVWNSLYDLESSQYGEAYLAPLNNSVSLKGIYHF